MNALLTARISTEFLEWISKGCPVTVTGRSSNGLVFTSASSASLPFATVMYTKGKEAGVLQLDGRAEGIDVIFPELIFLGAEEVPGLQIRNVDPTHISQHVRIRQVDVPTLQALSMTR